MHHFIGAAQRNAVLGYRYSSVDQSLVSRYVLGPYWNWLVTLFPTTIAPNMITLLGLAFVVSNVVSLLWFDPVLEHATAVRRTLLEQRAELPVVPLLPRFGNPGGDAGASGAGLPSWLLFVWAVCLFTYQSLDSIDGKQARRTGMSSPLGELFDHGCDALNTSLECILAFAAFGLGRSSVSLFLLVSSMASFYLTTWEEYYTHTLFLSVFSGPVEGILIVCVLFIVSGAAGGPAFFARGMLSVLGIDGVPWVRAHLARANWSVGEVLAVGAASGLFFNALTACGNVVRRCREQRVSIVRPLCALVPFAVQVAANVCWAEGNRRMVYEHAPAFVPFVLFWGLSFAYLVGIVIVAHVCRMPFPYWNVTCVVSIVGAVDANLPTPILQRTPGGTLGTVCAALAFSFALYAYFVVDVIQAMTAITGKPCLRVAAARRD